MTKQITLLSLIVATILLTSTIPAFSQAQVPGANWEMANYATNGGSYSPQTQITRDNVQYLETKWVLPFQLLPQIKGGISNPTPGAMSPPIIVDGKVYVVKNSGHILAIDAQTGKQIWMSQGYSNVNWTAFQGRYPWMAPYAGHIHAMYHYSEKGWLMVNNNSCFARAWNIKDGSVAWEMGPEQLCGTNEQMGNPVLAARTAGREGIGSLGNQGYMGSRSNPPAFLGNIMVWPSTGVSGQGGRSSMIGFDMSDPKNPRQLWRTWVAPPAQGDPNWAIDQCKIANGNGWYFEAPRFFETPGYKATRCTEVPDDVVRNDWINMIPNTPHFGKLHTASSVTSIWGHMPLDPELGLVYLGFGDLGPYPNSTFKYGPNLHGSGFVALDVRTGALKWWFAANPHDLWDYDCSWGGILGEAAGKKVYIKACKNGIVYVLDRATGEPVWVFDSPTNWRSTPNWNYGVDKSGNPRSPDACCRMTKEHMSKPWMHYPSEAPIIGPQAWAYIESDIAYDPTRKVVYAGTFNAMRELKITNYRDFGNQGQTTKANVHPHNATINAYDMNTGKIKWMYGPIDGGGFRGGIMTTGGMVIAYMNDGNIHVVDAETGQLVRKMFFGHPVNVMPTIGADKNGKFKLFIYVGGSGIQRFNPVQMADLEGSLVAYGLPDKLPQPEVIPKEVIKEVVKEVPKEVIKEVVKEVPKEVTVETISPISYAAIGIGVVMIVISGILFSRRKKA